LKALQVCLEGRLASSGASYSVPRLTDALSELHCDARLIGIDWPGLVESPRTPRHNDRFFPTAWGAGRMGISPRMRRWIDLEARSADLIHFHSVWLMPAVYASRAASRHSIPFVVSPHGTLAQWAFASGSRFKPLLWKFLQRPALDSVACFHATAESEYQDIRRHGFRQPVAVIPHGIDLPSLGRALNPNVKTLLFLSRIHPKKGIANLLHAWATVQGLFPNWQLKIAGPSEGGHLNEMQTLASQLRLGRIEFIGEQIGANKWATFARADLFVLPTHSENFGICVTEALATGVPTIVSKGAPWGQILAKRAGWWPDVGIDPLVECLKDAMSRAPEDLQAMGKRGRIWMEEDFSWPAVGKEMADVYQWISNGGPRPDCVRID
jgi:glycosyltransferase involved in cell wall biosynthesis